MSSYLVLKVFEARQKDVGRGRIRISDHNMQIIGISPGDIVEILSKDHKNKQKGERNRTGAIVFLADSEDKNANLIRIDGITRRNIGVKIGESAIIRKVITEIATKVTITPFEKITIDSTLKQFVKQKLLGIPVTNDDMVLVQLLGQAHRFIIESALPNNDNEILRITEATQLVFNESLISDQKLESQIYYEDIGGLETVIQKIREMIELPLRYPELFKKLGISPPKGVLLHGPPGTGKTLLAKAVANESEANFVSIQGPEIMSKFYGESEAKLREIFKNAEKKSPSIIFIDEIDAIASKREELTGEVERRVVAQILSLMDGMSTRGNVIVIGATNRPDAIDEALRRPGRFDREIYTNIPDQLERFEILQIHSRRMPGIEKIDIQKLSQITHGFVGADLAALAREAAMNSLREILPLLNMEKENIKSNEIERLEIKERHFINAMKEIQPTAIREVFVEKPNISWEMVGGLNELKLNLIEMIEWPLKKKEALARLGISPPRGILLCGPPGTGKTLLAKAVATNSEANFLIIKGPELLSKWVGETERSLREIFQKARMASPSIIFFDEIDAIAQDRTTRFDNQSSVSQSLLSQLLTEFDSIESVQNVVILAATNRPDLLDLALLRPGRFDRILYINPPDLNERLEIFKIHTSKMPLASDVILADLAQLTEYFTGAEIESLCREAGMVALREDINIKLIKQKHFQAALNIVYPSITPEILAFYERFALRFKSKLLQKELSNKDTSFNFI
ncbi:MAG: CDC48 family AAA ATPase [Candidatus Hodarchaeales archaeon]